MHGTTTIELTNVKTGEKEVIQHDNMVTNAVKDVLQLNPFGVGYRMNNFASLLFPIQGHLIGGIQLFAERLEDDDANNYFAPYDNPVTGYASMDVSPVNDARRGSLNQIESGALPDRQGYRFVWDFATSQGNGVIASLGLCDVEGGKASAGGEYELNTELYELYYSGNLVGTSLLNYNTVAGIIHLVPEENCCYSIFLESSQTIRIRKVKLPITSFGVTENIALNFASDFEDVTTITTDAFGYVSSSYAYLSFCYDDSGYIWGFQHDGNADGNSSGDANISWIKIDVSDWSYEEGMWTINDASIYRFGWKNMSSLSPRQTFCLIHHGNLYCRKYNGYGIYKINLNNPTNVTLLPDAGRGSGVHAYINIPYRYDSYYSCTLFNVIGDTIIFPGGHIVDDVVHSRAVTSLNNATYGRSHGEYPKLQYGPFLFMFPATNTGVHVRICLIRTYLATINNLSQTVEKTADKTMKITYTLYETDEPEPEPEPEPGG